MRTAETRRQLSEAAARGEPPQCLLFRQQREVTHGYTAKINPWFGGTGFKAGQETPTLLLGPSPWKACPDAGRQLLSCAHLQELTKTRSPGRMPFAQPLSPDIDLCLL